MNPADYILLASQGVILAAIIRLATKVGATQQAVSDLSARMDKHEREGS